jgi:Mn2+/Fe2+ NRAMP family transporter
VVSLVLTFLGVSPIQLIFWSNVVAAIIAPLLVIAILLVGNHRTIMKGQRLSLLHNVCLVLITLILLVGSVLFFYQLATGQGS